MFGNKASKNTVVHDGEKLMNTQKQLVIVASTMRTFLVMLPLAGERGRSSYQTYLQQGRSDSRGVLLAGTYWFVQTKTTDSPDIIRLFNSDRSMLYATILTMNAQRLS
jgi:hypothetical protein